MRKSRKFVHIWNYRFQDYLFFKKIKFFVYNWFLRYFLLTGPLMTPFHLVTSSPIGPSSFIPLDSDYIFTFKKWIIINQKLLKSYQTKIHFKSTVFWNSWTYLKIRCLVVFVPVCIFSFELIYNCFRCLKLFKFFINYKFFDFLNSI
jgi:hypothetical protein